MFFDFQDGDKDTTEAGQKKLLNDVH